MIEVVHYHKFFVTMYDGNNNREYRFLEVG